MLLFLLLGVAMAEEKSPLQKVYLTTGGLGQYGLYPQYNRFPGYNLQTGSLGVYNPLLTRPQTQFLQGNPQGVQLNQQGQLAATNPSDMEWFPTTGTDRSSCDTDYAAATDKFTGFPGSTDASLASSDAGSVILLFLAIDHQ